MEVGRSARIAYINSRTDQELHRLDSLRIRPGVVVTLHQRYPSYVVECEDGNIALDEETVSSICVWRGPEDAQPGGQEGRPNEAEVAGVHEGSDTGKDAGGILASRPAMG